MQALRIIERVSADGYLHIKIPLNFSAKNVELIIMPIDEGKEESASADLREPDAEWDIDYDAADTGIGQTLHTFELLDHECGLEEPSQWR